MQRRLIPLLCGLAVSSSAFAQSFSLPIWKEKAEALGYDLPKPIGFNLSYMSLEQGIQVDSIGFSGLHLPNFIRGIDMQAEQGKQTSEVVTLRADMWLFPFLNVYALAGKMTGKSETSVNYAVSVKPLLPGRPDHKIKGRIDNFSLDLDGYLYGGGIVLAGGYENWFGLVDASYTQTQLTVIDGNIDAWVISPRVGYDFHKLGVPLRIWGGAMYQNVEQSLSGQLSELGLPSALNPIVKDGKFHIEQRLTTEWNPIMGAQYQINPNLNLLAEFGFGDRQSAFVSIDFRY
ncbi:TonB-dependent receptor [Photobacterium damselae subsp. damselae]|uniref:TonB-dependent receptor n=1 Tax=Photobacterium damselae TaxID=38293 RepID=UPI001F236135|nr:TonB-dependent receptor [Photobacterium damselae]UJZ95800.1 TonB-dependent receptor [Photobacterium damselae subsp. damselae]UKA00295.1 TonB-dependent receptor [Photobacterium damselae subsp. damselae]